MGMAESPVLRRLDIRITETCREHSQIPNSPTAVIDFPRNQPKEVNDESNQ